VVCRRAYSGRARGSGCVNSGPTVLGGMPVGLGTYLGYYRNFEKDS